MKNLRTYTISKYFAILLLFTYICWGAISCYDLEYFNFPEILLFLGGGLSPALWAIIFVNTKYHSVDQRKEFFAKIFNFTDIGFKWLLVIILYPLITLVALLFSKIVFNHSLSFSTTSTILREPKAYLLSFFPVLIGVVGEEIGWRGYAQRFLGEKKSLLVSALIIGIIWALWHIPLFFITETYQNSIGFLNAEFYLYMIELLPQAFLIGWVFYKTKKSTLAAVLFHLVINMNPIEDLFLLDYKVKAIRFIIFLIISASIILKDNTISELASKK